MAYFLLYFDDIILTTSSATIRKSIISQLNSEFSMKDLGPMNFFLGIVVTRHQKGIFLSQKKYAEEILVCVGMLSRKPCLTPVDN